MVHDDDPPDDAPEVSVRAVRSLRKAIDGKCKDCIYDPLGGGTWREQVEACTSEDDCTLWPVRPLPSRKNRQDDSNRTASPDGGG